MHSHRSLRLQEPDHVVVLHGVCVLEPEQTSVLRCSILMITVHAFHGMDGEA
jgi:hypothetical protein